MRHCVPERYQALGEPEFPCDMCDRTGVGPCLEWIDEGVDESGEGCAEGEAGGEVCGGCLCRVGEEEGGEECVEDWYKLRLGWGLEVG